MGSCWPLQEAQPLGGKFQLMIFISPRKGSDMFRSLACELRDRCPKGLSGLAADSGVGRGVRWLKSWKVSLGRALGSGSVDLPWDACSRRPSSVVFPVSEAARILTPAKGFCKKDVR